MSVESEITRITTAVSDSYDEIVAKGGTATTDRKIADLASSINTISVQCLTITVVSGDTSRGKVSGNTVFRFCSNPSTTQVIKITINTVCTPESGCTFNGFECDKGTFTGTTFTLNDGVDENITITAKFTGQRPINLNRFVVSSDIDNFSF